MEFRIFRINRSNGDQLNNFRRAYFEARRRGFMPPSLLKSDYDLIQIVEAKSYYHYKYGNDGMQGWRHKKTGYVIPDICRMNGGYPDMWWRTRGAVQLSIQNIEQIKRYVVYHGKN